MQKTYTKTGYKISFGFGKARDVSKVELQKTIKKFEALKKMIDKTLTNLYNDIKCINDA